MKKTLNCFINHICSFNKIIRINEFHPISGVKGDERPFYKKAFHSSADIKLLFKFK